MGFLSGSTAPRGSAPVEVNRPGRASLVQPSPLFMVMLRSGIALHNASWIQSVNRLNWLTFGKRVRGERPLLRLSRSAAEATALLAVIGVMAVWGSYESAERASSRDLASVTPAAVLSSNEQIAFEGSVILTESPVSNQSSTLKIVRAGRSGLTTTSPNIISLTPGEDPFGGGTDSVLPALPPVKKTHIRSAPSGTYRTLCVRLCDGYYWPVSFSTTTDGLGEDKEKCESSCGVPVKLFYYRNPDGQPEDAVDLKGEPYMQLANAFRYRNEYVSQCKCQPDPWEAASLDRHKQYAVLAQEGKLALYDNRKPQKRRKKRDRV